MIGKYAGFKTRDVNTKKGKSTVYDAIVDGKSLNVGFKKDIIDNIPVGATVEYSVSDGQYPTLTSIVITTKALPVEEKAKESVATKPVSSTFTPQDFSTPNRLRALEIIFSCLFLYYTSADRKQKLSIPAILGKILAFADIFYNYAVTGNSVVSSEPSNITPEGE